MTTDLTLEAIQAARQRLAPYLQPTPLVFSAALTRAAGRKVWLKLETQQPTGSFKVRPALNGALVHIAEARRAGVIASSSGNFAQAVAYGARELALDATIVMMANSSPYKMAATEALGAKIVLCGNTFEERWETTYRLQRETGRILLHPYDSPETLAGDATLGLELLEQLPGTFTVAVPVSGGGLISGVATAVKLGRPGCAVIGVQPEANGAFARSLQAGHRVNVGPVHTIADALVASSPGEHTFEIVREKVDAVVLVSEEEIAEGVRQLAWKQKLIAEPGGAVAVSALVAGRIPAAVENVVCVVSGGNVLPATLLKLLEERLGS
ncbi:MAG TPA: threonine/serine dehydratase [Bryobacterales bacterium]|nr:threonine/serine dehydratase [Bryobacterales bacterium]